MAGGIAFDDWLVRRAGTTSGGLSMRRGQPSRGGVSGASDTLDVSGRRTFSATATRIQQRPGHLLRTRLRLSESEVAALSRQKAIAALEKFWSG